MRGNNLKYYKVDYYTKILGVFIFILLIILQPNSLALTADERSNLFRPFYDKNSTIAVSGCNVGQTPLVGADNEAKVWNYLINKGFTPIQAAGSLGNLKHEGGFNPKRVEDGHMEGNRWLNKPPLQFPRELDYVPPHDLAPISKLYAGQPGYGIVQWTSPGRKSGLKAFAATKNLPEHDLGMQLDYMWSELEGPYKKRALDPLLATSDLAEAVRIWQDHYEVGSGFQPRYDFAVVMLAKYGSGTSDASTSSGGSTCGGGQVTGGYSLPVDKEFYDEHPAWFSKPHHDYPAADIPVPEGTSIYAIRGGVLTKTGGTCGNGVTIAGDDGITYQYCHGSDGGDIAGASNGDTVTTGQLIMHSSHTGRVIPPGLGGSHLHLGMVRGSVKLCPQSLLVGIATGAVPDINTLPTSGCSYVSR